jgi:cardiolipin synthase A/B
LDSAGKIVDDRIVSDAHPLEAAGSGLAARWWWRGDLFFDELERRINQSSKSIRLEFYIFHADALGRRVLGILAAAARRGCRVQVLVDGLHSPAISSGFWQPLMEGNGQVGIFSHRSSRHPWIRNHRKLVVVDDLWAAVGGFNVAEEYGGDGHHQGWLDCGLSMEGPAVGILAIDFDRMWSRVSTETGPHRFHHEWIRPNRLPLNGEFELLRSGPGQIGRSLPSALCQDIRRPGDIALVAAYFLPGIRLRRALLRAARSGRRVQILLPGITDVPLARRAGRYLYHRFLKAGVEIYEYQPRILHAKLYVAGGAAYVGSANLDVRSLRLNHELMVRTLRPPLVSEALQTFRSWLALSERIDPNTWATSRGLWEKLREKIDFWVLARLDPFISRQLDASEIHPEGPHQAPDGE